jgi:conjugal transfer mating pair stabilization protein TraG
MWEIYAYQNSESLFGVFNAAAAIHASNNYLSALALVAFCGFVAALIAYAFAPEKLQGWKWLATVVMVFAILIVPKVSVVVVDKTGGTPDRIVDNVPFGVAALGSLTSTVGHTITTGFETAFQVIPGDGGLPSELAYSRNGLMFGNRLVRETSRVVFQDPGFRTDLINFIHNCAMYDLLDGTIRPSAFATSDNVWFLMGTPNPARFTTVTRESGLVDVDNCQNVYRDLGERVPAQVSRIEGRLAFQLNPTLSGTLASSVIAGQIQQAYIRNRIADASMAAADLIRQNAMLNAINDASQIAGQRMNDPASMVLAVGRAQSVAQQNATWMNLGKIAEQALPVFRNVIEAVSYAMFPLLVLLLLLTSGRDTMMALKGYASLLIWIQLWPPLYAVLNYMASIYAAYDLAAAANIGDGGRALSLQTASAIYAGAVSGEAIVGSLTFSIPFLAWAVVKRLETLGTAMIGGLSGLQAAITGSTSSATAGNVSMGNVGMDQFQLAPNRTSAFMGSLQNDLTGNTLTSNMLTGRSAMSLLRNQGFASRVVSVRVSEQEVNEASQQAESARSEAVGTSLARSAMLTEAFNRGMSKLRSASATDGTSSSSYEQYGETLNRLDQISRGIAARTNVSQAQVMQIAFGANASLGVGTPGGSPVQAKAGVEAKAGKTYQSGVLSDEQKVLGAMTSEQLAEFKQFGERISKDKSLSQLLGADAKEGQEWSSRFAEVTSRAQRAEAAFSQRRALAERLSTAREKGDSISIDLAQDPHNLAMFMRYAEEHGGDSAAAKALIDAELARQALRPSRAFGDGTAVPASFGDLRQDHTQQQKALGAMPAPEVAFRRYGGRVRSKVLEQPQVNADAPPSTGVREEVSATGHEIKTKVEQAGNAFDTKAGVSSTVDGTLKSNKSLTFQTFRQVVEDGSASLDTAKEALDSALKPKAPPKR